jgi:hypothetical protein
MAKLCPPEPKSPILLYVSASNLAVSAVLVQEKDEEGKLRQIPVYFASEALSGSKIFYSELENIATSHMRSSWQQGSYGITLRVTE